MAQKKISAKTKKDIKRGKVLQENVFFECAYIIQFQFPGKDSKLQQKVLNENGGRWNCKIYKSRVSIGFPKLSIRFFKTFLIPHKAI